MGRNSANTASFGRKQETLYREAPRDGQIFGSPILFSARGMGRKMQELGSVGDGGGGGGSVRCIAVVEVPAKQ